MATPISLARRIFPLLMAAAAWCAAPHAGAEQPIKLLVGYAPGGGVDSAARIVAQKMQQALGQSVIVDNRPGAGGMIAASALAASPPDGQTLLMSESGLLVTPHIYKNVKFSIQKSFEPVGMVGRIHLGLVSSSQLPAATPAELIALLKKSPGAYSYGTPGVGTLQHLGGELFKSAAGVDMLHVPYRGGSQVIKDLASNDIPLGMASLASVMPQAKSGKMRIIAVMSEKRLPSLPSVPAMNEVLPGVTAVPGLFVLAPAGTPAAVVARLNQALRAAVLDKATAEAFDAQGIMPDASSPAELGAWMRSEEARWADVVRKGNLSLE
jgi:tripartite-type tricarboxylate transporter receptor subunit TctC